MMSRRQSASTRAASRGRETADITPSAGRRATVRVLLEPRGSRRLSVADACSISACRRRFRSRARAASKCASTCSTPLNDTAEESIASDRYDSPTLGVGNVFLDPRRVMLSVKMNLGK